MSNITKCVICGGRQYRLFRRGQYAYERCCTCRTVSSNPIPSADEIAAHYARKFAAGNYDLRRKYAERYNVVLKAFVDILSETVPMAHILAFLTSDALPAIA